MECSIKAIFFDIDDTVYSTTNFAESARRSSVRAMINAGLKIDEETCYQELLEVINEFPKNYSQHFDKLLLRLPQPAIANMNPSLIVAAGIVAYHDTKFRQLLPYEDCIEVLKILTTTNLKLGIITSGLAIKQSEKIIRLGLNKYIDNSLVFISDQMGISKHNIKIFQMACNHAEVAAHQTIYVGDNAAVDVDFPNQTGMITVLSKRGGKYLSVESTTNPHHVIQNFWDLLEILTGVYKLQVEY